MGETHLGHLVKHKELVVVPATRELVVVTPLEPTHFLPVHRELVDPVVLDADVAVVNQAVVRSRRQDVVVPSEGADYVREVSVGKTVKRELLLVDSKGRQNALSPLAV